MYNWLFVLFAAGIGFAAAGVLTALHRSTAKSDAKFELSFANPLVICWGTFVCLFAGPYMVATKAYNFWSNGRLALPVFSFCFLVSVFWSFCSGILIFEALRLSGLITA